MFVTEDMIINIDQVNLCCTFLNIKCNYIVVSVALSHLGEKTTVLSPEVIAASGIPCCRLVVFVQKFC